MTLFSIFVYCVWVPFWIYLMIRNSQVSNFRRTLLKKVSDAAHDDLHKERDPFWRYDTLDSVSYNRMMFQFWKPLRVNWFYKDDLFIRRDAVKSSPDMMESMRNGTTL